MIGRNGAELADQAVVDAIGIGITQAHDLAALLGAAVGQQALVGDDGAVQ